MRAKITLQVKRTAASRYLRMYLRYLKAFSFEFYKTFLNFYVSGGIYAVKKDQNFRTVKHPQEVQITKPGNFQMLVFPSLGAN